MSDIVHTLYATALEKAREELSENKSVQGRITIHSAYLHRLSLSWNVIWISHEKQGLFVFISHADELVHLRRFHGILTADLLLSAFNPLYAFCLTLMVNARHLFYGISMLDKYKNIGWKKPYLIFALCDESFTINCSVTLPPNVDKGWFMFFVTLLNHFYWVLGATMGALLGFVIHFDTTGIEFVMTALFVVMFINQWEETNNHRSALTGIGCSFLCLILFGSKHFIIPAMAAMILYLSFVHSKSSEEVTQ